MARQVGVPKIVVFMNKVDLLMMRKCLNWLKWKLENFLINMNLMVTMLRVIQGSALKHLKEMLKLLKLKSKTLMDAVDAEIPEPVRLIDQAFPDAY